MAAFVQPVDEIAEIYRSLPPRPSIEEVEAAISVIETVNSEEQLKLEEISNQICAEGVSEELFSVLQQVRKNMVLFRSHEQRKEALHLVEADKMFESFAGLIQKASVLVSGDTHEDEITPYEDPVEKFEKQSAISEQILITRRQNKELKKKGVFEDLIKSSSTRTDFFSDEGEPEKLSLMKVAALIEKSAKTKALALDLKGKLMDKVEWLPLSIGKLSLVTEMDLSQNRIMAIPTSMSSLKSLTKLDIHSNQLINLPDSFGDLINLTNLDLHANRLKSLPLSFRNLSNLIVLDLSSNQFTHLPETIGALTSLKILNAEANKLEEIPYTIGMLFNLADLDLHANRLNSLPSSFRNLSNLIELDLSSNEFTHLPETIGDLVSLQILNAETNEIEEIPYTIGNCSSLMELRLNFNQLKALPEGIGKLEKLEILSLHYNRIKGLPTTMGNLSNLSELDVSFNELESIPENLCFAVNLKKLNVGNNFADLRELPRSIGNLALLEELNISADQIRVLPDSFRLLSKLRVFRADETPLEVPPRQVAKLGAEAVVQFMKDSVAKRETRSIPSRKKKGVWSRICLIFWPFKRNSL